MMKILNSIIIFLVFPLFIYSQENDFQFWSSVSVSNKITKNTNIYLRHGLRFKENASMLAKSFSDIKLRYKYSKNILLAIGYRDINEWNQYREQESRYYVDLYFKKKQKRFILSLRNRYQKQGNAYGYDYIFRQRLSTNYNMRKTKLEPLVAFEYFYGEDKEINKLRYTISLSYPICKKIDLELAYRIQEQINIDNPDTFYIIEGKCTYDL